MMIDMGELSDQDAYFTMTQTFLPRPIAWVITQNQDSSFNLAPFSFFNAICSDPPLLVFSVGAKPTGGAKDTLVNINTNSQFVINIASVDQLALLNQSAANLPYGVSEVDSSDIELATVSGFDLPRIAQCKIAMMCETYQVQTIGNNDQVLVFGQIKGLYLDDDCAEINPEGRLKIAADRVQPLARLGAGQYASFGQVIKARSPD